MEATEWIPNRSLLDYYLTGWRRAADIARLYTGAILGHLDEGATTLTDLAGVSFDQNTRYRAFAVVRHINLAYSFTWDLRLRALADHGWSGHDLYRVTQTNAGYALVRVPKDAAGGVYEIISNRTGGHAVLADQRVPLAIYAPGGWRPAPMNPPAPVYFRVPADAAGRVYFERATRLFTPSGAAFRDEAQLSGWVDLS